MGSRFRKEYIRDCGKLHYEGPHKPKFSPPVFSPHKQPGSHLDPVNFITFPPIKHKEQSNYDPGFISYLRKTVAASQNLEQVTTLLLLNLFDGLPESRFRHGAAHGHGELDYNRAQLSAYLRDIPCIEVVFHDGDPSSLGKFSNKSRYVFKDRSELKEPFPWNDKKYHLAYVGCPARLLGLETKAPVDVCLVLPNEQGLFSSISSHLASNGVMATYAEIISPLKGLNYLEDLANTIELYQKE